MFQLRILAIIPNPKDATSFYRAIGPLSSMEKDYAITYDVLTTGDELSWIKMLKYDVVFLQRPCIDAHMQAIKLAKQLGKPVWVDFDDDVFTIPRDNPAHLYYSQNNVRDTVKSAISWADMVTVSTEALRSAYSSLSEKILVCRNAYNDTLITSFREPKKQKIICWRGTNTHERDVRHFATEIISIMKENPDWKFACLGANWWFLSEELNEQYMFQATTSVIQFFSMLYDVGAAIQIVPLFDNEFNKSKSNIAWQEASIAGSACVVPTFKEWEECDGAKYTGVTGFGESIRYLINNPNHRDQMVAQSRKMLDEQFKLSHVNKKRIAGLEALIGKKIAQR
jgi:hypothetical protein